MADTYVNNVNPKFVVELKASTVVKGRAYITVTQAGVEGIIIIDQKNFQDCFTKIKTKKIKKVDAQPLTLAS